MPRVRIEPTIRAFEREKTVYALHRAATVIVSQILYCNNFIINVVLLRAFMLISSFYFLNFFIIRLVGGGVQLGPLGTEATDWPIVPAPGDYDDGEFGGMKIGRGNRNTRRKPAPVPLCPPQISLDQTWDRTRAAAVGSQRLTA
jgi:hypothetical protein